MGCPRSRERGRRLRSVNSYSLRRRPRPRLSTSRAGRRAGLPIDFDVGVATAATYVVKRIDSDYFEES